MRWVRIAAWFAVLALAGFFWLQLQWARMLNDMDLYHLGKCSQELDRTVQQVPRNFR